MIRTRRFAIAALLAAGLAGSAIGCTPVEKFGEEERPPIIVENGSIKVSFDSGGNPSKKWKKESDGIYEQKIDNGKTAVSFEATVGGCTVKGAYNLVIHFSGGRVEIERHRVSTHKYHVDVVFASDEGVTMDNSKAMRMLTLADVTATEIEGDAGVKCAVTGPVAVKINP